MYENHLCYVAFLSDLICSLRRRVTRGRRKGEERVEEEEGARRTISPTPTPSSSTVASPSPRNLQGRATRSRSDLRLRDRTKVETPDVSSQGLLGDATANQDDDVNGNSRAANDDGLEDEAKDRKEEGVMKDDEDDEVEEEEKDEGDENADNEDSGDDSEETNENDADADMDGGQSDNETDDINEDGGEECEGEGCHCTSNWSCGGHAGLRRAGPCSSTPRLQVMCSY